MVSLKGIYQSLYHSVKQLYYHLSKKSPQRSSSLPYPEVVDAPWQFEQKTTKPLPDTLSFYRGLPLDPSTPNKTYLRLIEKGKLPQKYKENMLILWDEDGPIVFDFNQRLSSYELTDSLRDAKDDDALPPPLLQVEREKSIDALLCSLEKEQEEQKKNKSERL